MREVCYHLVLVLWFGDFLSLDVLQLLDLLCGPLFSLCAIGICERFFPWFMFGSLVCIWFFGFVFVRELFGCI